MEGCSKNYYLSSLTINPISNFIIAKNNLLIEIHLVHWIFIKKKNQKRIENISEHFFVKCFFHIICECPGSLCRTQNYWELQEKEWPWIGECCSWMTSYVRFIYIVVLCMLTFSLFFFFLILKGLSDGILSGLISMFT